LFTCLYGVFNVNVKTNHVQGHKSIAEYFHLKTAVKKLWFET